MSPSSIPYAQVPFVVQRKQKKMAKKSQTAVHTGFRIRPELHRELQELAKILNLDMSGLLNHMLAEALPAVRKQAADLKARDDASKGPYPVSVADWPLVQQAIGFGMHAKKDRMSAMRKAITDTVGD